MIVREKMKKIFPAIFVLFFIAQAEVLNIPKNKILEWQKGVVYLNYDNQAEATGFFVSPDGIIAGPYHVIQGWDIFADSFHIYVVPYRKLNVYKAEILYKSRKRDLILIKIDFKPEVWFDKFENPVEGESVIVLGHPFGWRFGKEAEIILHLREEVLGLNIIPLSGASGSVVLSKKGKVKGMLTKKFGYSIIIHSVFIKNAIKKIKERDG